jgi:hypothetical protein
MEASRKDLFHVDSIRYKNDLETVRSGSIGLKKLVMKNDRCAFKSGVKDPKLRENSEQIARAVLSCFTGHEDFKATDARDADWLIVRCNESFDGGLPITSFELEVYSDESVYHVNTIYINHTDKAGAFGPIFEVPGLEPGRNYRLLLYAVNAKGRSDPVVLEPVTLKGVAMYTTGECLNHTCPASSLPFPDFRLSLIVYPSTHTPPPSLTPSSAAALPHKPYIRNARVHFISNVLLARIIIW